MSRSSPPGFSATRFDAVRQFEIQDNGKLPAIMGGVRRIFAEPTRRAVAAIALHQSITSLAAWPVPASLTDDQVRTYIDSTVFTPLLTLTLADTRRLVTASLDRTAASGP